jgi:hypothetical protein
MKQYDWVPNGFFTTMVYTTGKTSPVENFKHGRKNDMDANMATLFAKGTLGQENLTSGKLQLEG